MTCFSRKNIDLPYFQEIVFSSPKKHTPFFTIIIMKRKILILLTITLLAHLTSFADKAKKIMDTIKDSSDKTVLVVAHRGAWHVQPENSIKAIEECIAIGVDIVEFDVRKTKDGKLVVIHDTTVDRTTNGTGKVSELTFEEIRKLYLKDKDGKLTKCKIPTFEEAMLATKGRIVANIDTSISICELLPILIDTKTIDEVIYKNASYTHHIEKARQMFGKDADKIVYMPILSDKKMEQATKKIVENIEKGNTPVAYELIISPKDKKMFSEFNRIKKGKSRVWVNTMWNNISGGYHDNLALRKPDAIWGELIRKGATMLQTDRPSEMLRYLRLKNLHN